ncbi:ABC transporter ATP-binding protein [Mycoplasmopsis pullorum]|uniref:ATP-binding cassette domain-containing protein n=4 Tax=Mycoplasmopsis pullorum TaxID=48003 RepID=UPI00111A9341|nr:ATP-binding cassette domain-containing protein [Mycoplasmopsis pullorum]TNK82653.1 ABC transporter ATP-binding protein [Mycoplasmopsis pullorum]TNK85171.1 ABC transporter ATP-binding protein [Mycoplasmopsis pullorum]TNK85672.1 ABC transporter ATP-binding protein [Mycoplasmopsis pullorum]TNK87035.1 ABC transporter ATP-binding protein [Mycoplasmopsis pullorum]TNK89421.1 ABC transporter ATP-binding protein [Mycoplasmopsis pullorum]
MSKKILLEIENLKKYFVNRSQVNKAVDGVSFKVHEGEIVGLIGESGSGKTTVGRSLLRLYDDFNGFVTLDGQIISGKRISRARNKQMRRNIQMIFQDPHASLNGQKTIFSILKEPLQVNGILKDEMRDLNRDWKIIRENFYYTFLENSKKIELNRLVESNKKIKKLHKSWAKKFEKVEFSNGKSLDDNFNEFFSYLNDKGTLNSDLISLIYKSNTELLELYHSKQKDFRNKEVDFDEKDLVEAQDEFEQAQKLTKHSKEYWEVLAQKNELVEQINTLKDTKAEIASISKNVFNNIIEEVKNEYKLQRNNALYSTNLDFYFHSLKLQFIAKAKLNFFRSNKAKLKYVSFDDAKEIVKQIDLYSKDIYSQMDSFDLTKKESIKLIKEFCQNSFKYDAKEFFAISEQQLSNLNGQIDSLTQSLTQKQETLNKIKTNKDLNLQDLEPYSQRLAKATQVHEEELNKYVESVTTRIANLDQEIVQANKEHDELMILVKQNDEKLKELHKKFVAWYNESILKPLEEQNKQQNDKNIKTKLKQAKVDLRVLESNVQERLEIISSFKAERKYLLKDQSNIYRLLGLDKFYHIVKNKKVQKVLNYALDFVYLYLIKGLFIKNKIYKALEDVGLLKQFAYRYPHEFSGGQRQRIVIARALITNPKLIVADEPIASLDISIQAQIVNLLKDLCQQKNIGMIFIAHDLSMIEYVADRVEIMHLGKIVENGVTEKIYDKPVHPYTINLFKAIPKISNANEKFENVSFELSYLAEQKFPNVPKVFEVEKDHFIYGTEEQFKKWTSK